MSFDGIARLRLVTPTDVPPTTWEELRPRGQMRIVGVYGSSFIVLTEEARILMVSTRDVRGVRGEIFAADNSDRPSSAFVNRTPECFAKCLVAYKEMRQVLVEERYGFGRPALREAVAACRGAMSIADPEVFSAEENYWAAVMADVDVW